jgi:hypothetical protein
MQTLSQPTLPTLIRGKVQFKQWRNEAERTQEAIHFEMVELARNSRIASSPLKLVISKLVRGNWQIRWRLTIGTSSKYVPWVVAKEIVKDMQPNSRKHYEALAQRATELNVMDSIYRHHFFWCERYLDGSREEVA